MLISAGLASIGQFVCQQLRSSAGMEVVDQIVAGGVAGGADDEKPVKPLSFTSVTEG